MKRMKYTIVGVIGFLIGMCVLTDINENLGTVFILIAISWIIYRKISKRKNKEVVPELTREKQEHYHEAGMSDKEIVFFRTTLSETKGQIDQLEKNFYNIPKLNAINLRYDTLKVAKAMFKEIVKEPKKLHLADKFLYTHLPNLVEMTNKYADISNHEIKSKETYDTLNNSIGAIENVSRLIIEDYENFVSDDIEDLEVEISIAKQNANKEAFKHNISDDQEEL
ncbi:5-bromo-4-chloroindolyl phosphate hydrolysis family protein [Vagococcus sp. CY53-2]|uniref:5-bromo-4-chloroindolyl phosphate hydrolysis family protein n=1 Tax=Vagococcus sp. CY53-2 TaxID=2925780 RepID=UPI001F50CFF7|nr:5-bromo-4-chloroindolyl phosphate hydrolysis family protein [Vagococcus sp. CY53-2]MCI0130693.1 5-bromo-4-chloroindolyl phosphate hydrolysis family protein [Vagococcus sp. CY53-2]